MADSEQLMDLSEYSPDDQRMMGIENNKAEGNFLDQQLAPYRDFFQGNLRQFIGGLQCATVNTIADASCSPILKLYGNGHPIDFDDYPIIGLGLALAIIPQIVKSKQGIA